MFTDQGRAPISPAICLFCDQPLPFHEVSRKFSVTRTEEPIWTGAGWSGRGTGKGLKPRNLLWGFMQTQNGSHTHPSPITHEEGSYPGCQEDRNPAICRRCLSTWMQIQHTWAKAKPTAGHGWMGSSCLMLLWAWALMPPESVQSRPCHILPAHLLQPSSICFFSQRKKIS